MLRVFLVLVVVGALFAGVTASAAWMNLQGGSEQVGVDSSLWCAQDPVRVVAWAVNTYGDAGDTEGLDWVTVQLSDRDAAACAGNDLTGRLDLAGGSHVYLGCYGDVAGDCSYWPVKSCAKIQTGKTQYKLAAYQRDFSTKAWPLGEDIQGIKLWLGGPANNP